MVLAAREREEESMNYKDFQNRVDYGTQMFDSGNLQAALEIFSALVSSDISDLDKSAMCLNIAVVYDKLSNVNQALEWYARAVQLEKPHCRYEAQEYWASYLKQINQPRKSFQILEALLASTHLTEADKVRVKENIEGLKVEINKPTYHRPGTQEEGSA
jgi:tetratricopeptide (TPR) repeat protein